MDSKDNIQRPNNGNDPAKPKKKKPANKKGSASPKGDSPKRGAASTGTRKAVSPAIRRQRENLRFFKEELHDLHTDSISVMFEQGILPPLYGGKHLGDAPEIVPLWGYRTPDSEPELGLVLLRVQPLAEPNNRLRDLREMLGLENDIPLNDVLKVFMADSPNPPLRLSQQLGDSILLVLSGEQFTPVDGLSREAMITHIGDGKPYAVFVRVPVIADDDEIDYRWDDLDKFRAEVICASSPELLEAAVWDYRFSLAYADDGYPDDDVSLSPTEVTATDIRDLVGMFQIMALGGLRLYGTTSPVQGQQQKLDVLRDEEGNLHVIPPLKPEVEPVAFLADARAEFNQAAPPVLLTILNDPAMNMHWPLVRPYRFFCIQVHYGLIEQAKGGIRLNGFTERPVYSWLMEDDLAALYRLVHLSELRGLLVLCNMVEPPVLPSE